MELDELYELIDNQPLSKVFETYPAADNFLRNNRLDDIDRSLPLIDGLKKIDPLILEEFDLTPADCICELAEYIAMVGSDCRILVPTSALVGGIFLILVDDLSRSVSTTEIPLGVLTAFIGAPFFIYLLARRDD